jgi:hypothetical protein
MTILRLWSPSAEWRRNDHPASSLELGYHFAFGWGGHSCLLAAFPGGSTPITKQCDPFLIRQLLRQNFAAPSLRDRANAYKALITLWRSEVPAIAYMCPKQSDKIVLSAVGGISLSLADLYLDVF